MRTVVLCAALVACLQPLDAGAQSLPLTEAEALARLSPASPRVRAISTGIDVARADVLAAGRWPNPRLTYDREAVAGRPSTDSCCRDFPLISRPGSCGTSVPRRP